MAKKKTQIDRAIDGLQAEIDVLQMAIARLRSQQAAAPKRKPRAVAQPTIMETLKDSLKADKAS